MIARTTRGSKGIANYLLKGQKKESNYDRDTKDKVNVLYGNLSIIKRTENYLNKEKQYKDNYLHITLSFSKDDIKRLNDLKEEDRQELKEQLVKEYIRHHTSGYDIDTEVIAYAEEHQAKIKQEYSYKDDVLKDRLNHIHIVVMMYNPLSDTKLRTTFAKTNYIDDVLQSYVNKKYNLTQPKDSKRERKGINSKSKISVTRKELLKDLKDIKSHNDLIEYFKINNIQYREVKTKSNHYYKVINKNGKDINLRGRGFEHLQKLTIDKNFKFNENKEQEELKDILDKYYKKRFEEIDSRRSKKTKQDLENIYNNTNSKFNTIEASYQQKIFYKYYKEYIKDDLKGFYVDTKKENEVKFINKVKDIQVVDKGNKVVANGNNTVEQVKLMLDIAEAKKWKLETLVIRGNNEFKSEVNRQIADRLKKTLLYTEAEAIKQEIKRPTTQAEQHQVNHQEKKQQQKINKDININALKVNLKASSVLKYAVDKYKLNIDNYELTDDNKINNKTNRQKPKNVIDFLQKEINLTSRQAIEICNDLYTKQPLNIKVEKNKELEQMGLKISICKDNNINALNKWEQVEIKSYTELASYMKEYPYSATQFDNGYRNSDNANKFNNMLIYDIDNDKDTPQLALSEAKQLLKQHNISAMILPSKSHNIDKNGHIAERYRIVIPTQEAISISDKATYREFQQLTARALKIDKYVDNKALNDKARYYYKSPISAIPHIIKSDRVMNISNLQERAINNIKAKKLKRQQEQKRASEIRANIQQYRTVQREASNNLTYANINKILNLNIRQLINHFEKDTQEYKDGNYEMIKTNNAKYSIIDNNVAHDFKNDITYNSLTYLQNKLNTTNLNIIARELQKITNDNYIELNKEAVNKAIKKSLKSAINDKTLEDNLKQYFNINYCKFDGDKITIADQHIKVNKNDIINILKENREVMKKQQEEAMQIQQSRGYSMSM